MYWIYNVLLIIYWIGLIPVILYRLAFEEGFYERIKQSAGYMPASLLKKIEGRRAIWIHAASVGEIVATSPLVKEVKKEFPEGQITILSMGMTNDFEIAIEEGATMVRIGTAIFGARQYH